MKGMLIMKYTAIFTAASVAALIAGSSAFAQDGLTGVQSLNDRSTISQQRQATN